MVALHTPPLIPQWQALHFKLKGTDNQYYSPEAVAGENGLVVMFICNHCPYVQAILDKIIRDSKELQHHGINSIAIMSNDTSFYPEDGFTHMQKIAQEKQFPFPYVIDETQEIARAYGAVCTPDFFGFDKELKLQYRGRLDDAGLKNSPDAKRELLTAMLEMTEHGHVISEQHPSIGCSIKWQIKS